MTHDELLQGLTELNGDAYMLKADLKHEEKQVLRMTWDRLNERLGVEGKKPKTLIIVPSTYDVEPLKGTRFDFATALRLMDMGYYVERDTWTLGSIYKLGNIIKHTNDNKEWIPTQGALRALNWRIV